MMKSNLGKIASLDLVELYTEIGLAQSDALKMFNNRRYNRLYDKRRAIEEELKSRPGDDREMLRSLLDHTNSQVRLNAAIAAYLSDPVAARAVLEQIRDTRMAPQSVDAESTLIHIDAGTSAIFK